jgi:hypothetical protein
MCFDLRDRLCLLLARYGGGLNHGGRLFGGRSSGDGLAFRLLRHLAEVPALEFKSFAATGTADASAPRPAAQTRMA